MFEERFLEQAIEVLEYWKQKYEELRKENNELKRQVCLYEKFVQDIKELLSEGNNEQCEKKNT